MSSGNAVHTWCPRECTATPCQRYPNMDKSSQTLKPQYFHY